MVAKHVLILLTVAFLQASTSTLVCAEDQAPDLQKGQGPKVLLPIEFGSTVTHGRVTPRYVFDSEEKKILVQRKGPTDPKPRFEYVLIEDLDKVKDARLVEDLLPLRIAMITGSFPFKKQVEEFQHTLLLRNPEDVFRDKDEQGNPRFRFLGINIQRRTVQGERLCWKSRTKNLWDS